LNSPAWTCWASQAFDKVSKCAITGSTLPNNKVSVCCCARVSAYCHILCLNFSYHLPTTRNPNPADQLCTTTAQHKPSYQKFQPRIMQQFPA
jgi:hypothetical protein